MKMRAALLAAVLLAVPALALAAHRHAPRVTHHSAPAAAHKAPAATTTAAAPTASDALDTAAQFAVVMDFDTGAVLFPKRGDDAMKPASMAKLMTVAILFEKLKRGELKLDDTFLVSENAWRQSMTDKSEASKMFVQVGDQIRVEDLIRGIVIQSGNDACIVVAEHVGGSEEGFARLMNAEAKRIGLTHSSFTNSDGMPDPAQNVTAHDLALLARHIIKDYPVYYKYFGEREFTWSKITQPNRNLLLTTYTGADGLKTGHTAESGYGITASAVQDGRRLIVVINGLTSEAERASEARRLLDIGFHEFKTYALFKPGEVVGEAEVWAGELRTVPLSVRLPVNIMLRRTSRNGLHVKLRYNEPVLPPVARGQQLGSLLITAPGAPDMSIPVYAGAAVDSGGLFTQMKVGAKALMTGKDEAHPAETAGTPDASQ
jgi:D-alanyl-D-alanine carboxypeptidase (penicillin-binding protein 5/6)